MQRLEVSCAWVVRLQTVKEICRLPYLMSLRVLCHSHSKQCFISHNGVNVIDTGFVLFAAEQKFFTVYLNFRPTDLI